MTDSVAISTPAPGVCVITLASPETRNALTLPMRSAISRAVRDTDDSDDIRCIVITGGNHVFSAGADVKAVVDYGPMDVARERIERYWDELQRCRKPIIAAVNGYALGGGCELAMLADIIVAGRGATFGQPEVALGIMPGSGATQRLPRIAGKYRAMHVLLTGTPFSAQEAQAMGLVSQLVDDSDVLQTAVGIAERIAKQSPDAVRSIKEVVLKGADVPLQSALLLERQAMQLLFDTPEQKRRMRGFLARMADQSGV